jgi:DNA invertase Pin-like site-specific DNA recombinase
MEDIMRAGIYARISEDRDETQAGVGRQLEDCERIAAAHGWDVAERYVDNDISAWKGGRRPEYERLKRDIEVGDIKAVAVYHEDRLHRQPRELEDFILLANRYDIALASVTGDIDLSTGDGRFRARIEGAVAAKESDDKSRRIRRKMDELARNGQPKGGGTRPFGFETDRVTVRTSEAKIIRELTDRLLAGESLRGLCADLNDRGVRTTTGGEWVPNVLKRMLRSARISGQREHHGQIVAKAVWPAIIRPEQTAQLRAILDDPSRLTRRAPRSYVLKGVLRCGRCGATLVGRPRDDGARRYVCARGPGFAGCGKTYVLAEPVEEFVTEAALVALDSPQLARAVRGAQDDAAGEWQRWADQVADKLDELARAYAADLIGMREWLAAREPLEQRLEEARRHLSRSAHTGRIARYVGAGGVLRKRWPELNIEERHAVITAVLARVDVGPGRRGLNRFDPGRFRLQWRY